MCVYVCEREEERERKYMYVGGMLSFFKLYHIWYVVMDAMLKLTGDL